MVVESRTDVRSAIKLFLELDNKDVAVTEIRKSDNLISEIGRSCPDIIMLDWEWPNVKPENLLPQIRGLFPEICIVVLCGRAEMQADALDAGADAFINKSDTPERMLETIKCVIS